MDREAGQREQPVPSGGRFDALVTARQRGRKLLVVYLMGGYPSVETSIALAPALAAAGADLIEVGLPFSDPIADGPVIQAAGQHALERMRGIEAYLQLIRSMRQKLERTPLVAMTYSNLIWRHGWRAFARDAVQAGLDGVIVPDLPLGEAGAWRASAQAEGLATIFLEAPNSSEAQRERIAHACSGFVYLLAFKGITGAEHEVDAQLAARVEALRRHTALPLVVGFGIASAAQAGRVAAVSDGIVVGSALVSRLSPRASLAVNLAAAVELVTALRQALDAPPSPSDAATGR